MSSTTGLEPLHARMAWGSHLYCWPDPLGLAVARTGVYDLAVTETLARLTDPGETVIDAGANVGLMSNLLAFAVGPTGRVVSFEPHPTIFQMLARNVAHWASEDGITVIDAQQAAVSSTQGTLPLSFDPEIFEANKGTASLEATGSGHSTQVPTVRLDDEFSTPIGVLKLDVEMHERAALEGAERLLSERLVRDIVLEEHEPPPTPVTSLLEAHGYTVLSVRQGLTGPLLGVPEATQAAKMWDPPTLLASLDPTRLSRRLRPRGWIALRANLGRRTRVGNHAGGTPRRRTRG